MGAENEIAGIIMSKVGSCREPTEAKAKQMYLTGCKMAAKE